MTVTATAMSAEVGRRSGARPRGRPRLSKRPRRLLRAGHVVVAGGWFGLVVAMLALGIAGLVAPPDAAPEATYRLMHVIGGRVIPPMAVATLATGVVLSLLTSWGLVRHWWVATKIVVGLAVIVTAVSLTDSWLEQAIDDPTGRAGVRLAATSGVHLALLAFATVISVDKPWGRTPRGRHTTARKEPA